MSYGMKTRKSKRLSQAPVIEEESKESEGDVIIKRQRLGKKSSSATDTVKCEIMGDSAENVKINELNVVSSSRRQRLGKKNTAVISIPTSPMGENACDIKNQTNGSLVDVKEEVNNGTNYDSDSSGSSSNEFLQPSDVLDFDPDFYKIKKEVPPSDFSSIENAIFSDVKRLSESDNSECDEPYSFQDNFKVLSNVRPKIPEEAQGSGSSKEVKTNEIEKKVGRKENLRKGKRNVKSSKGNNIDAKHSSSLKVQKNIPKNSKENDVDQMDVTQLLAHGEALRKESTETNLSHLSGSDEDLSDWEEVDTTDVLGGREHTIPEKGIEVTVKLPDMSHKRKKKHFDMEAYLKRKLNRRKREVQVLVHKVHLMCWIAHGQYVNSVLNSEVLMGVCLSLIPSKHCYPPDRANLGYLEQIVKWFNKTVNLQNEGLPLENKQTKPLQTSLQEQLEMKFAKSKRDLVLLFICLLRSLGLNARLVLSLQPLPLKPHSDDLCSLSSKNTVKSSKSGKKTEKKSPKQKDLKCSNEVPIKRRGVMSKEEALERLKDFKAKTCDDKSKSKLPKTSSNEKAGSISKQKEDVERKSSRPLRTRKEVPVKYKEESGSSDEDLSCIETNGTLKSCPKNENIDSIKNAKKNDSADNKSTIKKSDKVTVAENKAEGDKRSRSGRLSKGRVDSNEDKKVNGRKSRSMSKSDSKRTNVEVGRNNSSSDDFTAVPSCSSQPKKEKVKARSKVQEDSDFEPEIQAVSKRPSGASSKKIDRRVLSPDSNDETSGNKGSVKKGCDIWTEVYLEAEETWMSVDVPRGKVHCVQELYARATKPVTYVLAWNIDLTLKDVTRRYCAQFHTTTRKQRVDQDWWDETIKPFMARRRTARDQEEEEEMDRQLEDRPLPKTLSEYKNHPLYVLPRHLLKFEAIYPPDAPPLGFFRQEPVYARECVYTCHSREVWVKEAKVVRPGEKPYKIVKARPKYDRMTGKVISDLPLEIFGIWQVEDYIPPEAVDGKVPRNPYGNVELFKPCMLPKGTVHMQLAGLNRVARKLQIDCAPAMIGFDYHSGGSHPVYDGYVVCEEFKEILTDAWAKEQAEAIRREQERIDKRVYGNWRRLIKGLMIRERLKARYSFEEPSGSQKKRSKKGKVSSKRRKVESDDDDDSEWETIK